MPHYSWCDFYQTEERIPDNVSLIKEKDFSGNNTLQPGATDAYVFYCYFKDMNSPSDGGSILYEKQGNSILIEHCMFINSITEKQTGAIRVIGGNSIFAFVCGYQCKAVGNDGFSSVTGGDIMRTVNSVIDSSISHCKTSAVYTMVHRYGAINFHSVNLSHNNANDVSAFRCESSILDNKTNIGCNIAYCSISNNTANRICVQMVYYQLPQKHEIRSINLINNKGIPALYSSGVMDMISSCLYGESDPFFQLGDSNSSITFQSCYIGNKSKTGPGTMTFNDPTSPFVLAIPFIQTGLCVNEFDHIPIHYHGTHLRDPFFFYRIYKFFSPNLFTFFLSLN